MNSKSTCKNSLCINSTFPHKKMNAFFISKQNRYTALLKKQKWKNKFYFISNYNINHYNSIYLKDKYLKSLDKNALDIQR